MIQITNGKDLPKHDEYAARVKRINFFDLSYKGGDAYKEGKDASGEDIFIKHETESEIGAKRRKNLVAPRNFCKRGINKYNEWIFQREVEREQENAVFVEWMANVDRQKTTLHSWMQMQAKQAAKRGVSLTLMESTGGQFASQEQAEQAGKRLFLIDIHPSQLLHWETVGRRLTEALVLFASKRFAIHYREDGTFTKYNLDPKDPKSLKVVGIEKESRHGFEGVPIVQCFANPDQESMLDDVAGLQKEYFNFASIEKEELCKQTFTQYLALGVNLAEAEEDGGETLSSVDIAGRKIFSINKKDITMETLTADVSQAESLRASLQETKKDIWNAFGIKDPEVLQNTESGRSLKIQSEDIQTIAAAIADQAELAENEIIDQWKTGMQQRAGEVKPSDYPERFMAEDLAVELALVLDVLDSELPETMKRKGAIKAFNDMFPKATKEEKQKVIAEVEELYKKEKMPEPNEDDEDDPQFLQQGKKGA